MKKIFIYIIIGIVFLLSLKGCIIQTISFEDYILGSRTEENGQYTRAIFSKKNELLVAKKYEDNSEVGLYKVKGIYAIKYPFGFYHFKSKGMLPLGMKHYKGAIEVLDADLVLSYKSGETFPDVGQSFKADIVIYRDHFYINNDRWEMIQMTDEEKIEADYAIQKLKESI
ncbi:MAG: hypothetical protein GYA51_18740 [Candidatus Methanofastidiosa archaeon]|nr:hypothetical protein [Candidatus Methanofastidiosa archaeon]